MTAPADRALSFRADGARPVSVTPLAPPSERLARSLEHARSWLLTRQEEAGHWCAELEGDTTLESYMILLDVFFAATGTGRERRWSGQTSERSFANSIRYLFVSEHIVPHFIAPARGCATRRKAHSRQAERRTIHW